MEQITLGAFSKHINNKNVIECSQHGFTKGKSCLSKLITLSNEITSLEDEGKAMYVFYFHFSK